MIANQTSLKDRLDILREAGHASGTRAAEDLPGKLQALEDALKDALRLREWERAHRLREEAQSVRERIFEALRPNTIREEACVVRTPEDVRRRWAARTTRRIREGAKR